MKTKPDYHLTPKERWTFYLFAFGGSVFTSLTGVFNVYLSDLGITAGAIAIVLLITRVWDFVNDPIAGMIIERTPFKSGKYLPWLKGTSILLPVFGVAMFMIPQTAPLWVKIAVPTLLYILYEGSFTFFDIPLFGVRLVTTDSVQERTDLQSRLSIFGFIGVLAATLVFPQIRPVIGWQYTALLFGGIALLSFLAYPRVAKERFPTTNAEEPTIAVMLKSIVKNKQLLIFYGSTLICMCTNFVQVITLYLARHVYGSEQLMTGVGIAILLPSILVAVLIPAITKRIDKFNLLRISLVGFAVTGVVQYFAGYENIALSFIIMTIRGLFLGVQMLLTYVFTPDIVEWNYYIKGERNDAVAFSFQTFTAKTITALLSVLMMGILGAIGFVSGENAAQPQAVVDGIWALFTWIPSIGAVVALIAYSFYRPRDKKVQVMIRANHGEITREEAEAELAKLGGYRI